MNTKIYIPTKIKVGANLRKDTYTGALGFVIPYDENKKAYRQHGSWERWRQKFKPKEEIIAEWVKDVEELKVRKQDGTYDYYDRSGYKEMYEKYLETGDVDITKLPVSSYGSDNPALEVREFDNEPIEGFVLNKTAGGGRGWDGRQTVCRVYDPRGFEIEITVPNLLYILTHATSNFGKGLEGKFVYGWDKAKIALFPEESPNIAEMKKYTALSKVKSIKVKDLVPGFTYKKRDLTTVTFICKMAIDPSFPKNYSYVFYGNVPTWSNQDNMDFWVIGSCSSIVEVVEDKIHADFDKMLEDMQTCEQVFPHDESKDEYITCTLEECNAIPYYSSRGIEYKGKKYYINYFPQLDVVAKYTNNYMYNSPRRSDINLDVTPIGRPYRERDYIMIPVGSTFIQFVGEEDITFFKIKKYLTNGKEKVE